jgi:hypothetical protein
LVHKASFNKPHFSNGVKGGYFCSLFGKASFSKPHFSNFQGRHYCP